MPNKKIPTSRIMTPADFLRALSATRMAPDGATAQACRLVLVDGLTAYAASKQVGVGQPAISRALAKLRAVRCCPTCGQAVRG